MEAFLKWSNQQDCLSKIKRTETAGNGLFSKKEIKKDTQVLVIPFDQILTSSKALNIEEFANTVYKIIRERGQLNEDDDIESIARRKENEPLVLCLFLIYARYINTNTDWAPYIDILPALDSFKEHHFLFKEDIAFKGTCLEQIHRAKKSNLMQEYEYLGHDWTEDITFEMYQWAYSCFWSRAVALGSDYETQVTFTDSDKVMLPMFDFANHAQEPNIRWKLTNEGVELVSLIDIGADQQLYLSYGEKPNQELIFLHGFTIKDNPVRSRINLSILPMLNDDCSPIEKINCLKNMGLKPILVLSEPTENTNILYQVGWSAESLAAVYLLALEDDIHFEFEDLFLGKDKIKSADELRSKVEELPNYPLIQLRTIVLLLDGLEYLYSENRKYKTGDPSCYDEYRDEEASIIEEVIEKMSMERDNLMGHQVVIDFMNSIE